MIKTFPIELVRQIIEQKLFMEHLENDNFYGGLNQIALHSFYEQLKTQAEVDRFVETFRDITEQQNRMGLIGNGTIIAPENPTYTNLYSVTIIPLTFACNFRCNIENRDNMIITINNLIDKLKGRKVDIAQLDCNTDNGIVPIPFMVGTIGQYGDKPQLKDSDFVGSYGNIYTFMDNMFNKGLYEKPQTSKTNYFYVESADKLKVCKVYSRWVADNGNSYCLDTSGTLVGTKRKFVLVYSSEENDYTELPMVLGRNHIKCKVLLDTLSSSVEYETIGYINEPQDMYLDNGHLKCEVTIEIDDDFLTQNGYTMDNDVVDIDIHTIEANVVEDDGTINDIIFPPEHESFEKWKVSLSFDSIRCDEPRNLNANEYVDISFGGSATIVNNGVKLGNDLLRVNIKRLGLQAETYIDFTSQENNKDYWLEPLEMPSGLNANTNPIQLISNKFKTNSHTDAVANTLQYTFVCDENVDFLEKLYDYARYGTWGITKDDISPNMIFGVKEIYCSWGVYKEKDIKTKLVENVDIENTESDVLTLGLTMQVQGDNN